MKDSDGREYDGWVLRYPEDWGGVLDKGSFSPTRTDLWDNFLGPSDSWQRARRHSEIMRYRDMGFRLVKVQIVEVKE